MEWGGGSLILRVLKPRSSIIKPRLLVLGGLQQVALWGAVMLVLVGVDVKRGT